ncbi:MAG: hypothetical protein ACI8RD_005533, partial [Bacillariaceae sp.]|jgi:hypothetical protein
VCVVVGKKWINKMKIDDVLFIVLMSHGLFFLLCITQLASYLELLYNDEFHTNQG